MSDERYHLPGADFCVVVLNYADAKDAIQAAMPEHLAWLTKAYDDGIVLMSGRRTPWTGGVMLIRGTAAQADALLATMPFVVHGLATAEVIGFTTGMAAPAIAAALG